jgi:peptide-methionine (S)-S-oxide reductase
MRFLGSTRLAAYRQQYLDKNPHGYCPINSTGVACPLPA